MRNVEEFDPILDGIEPEDVLKFMEKQGYVRDEFFPNPNLMKLVSEKDDIICAFPAFSYFKDYKRSLAGFVNNWNFIVDVTPHEFAEMLNPKLPDSLKTEVLLQVLKEKKKMPDDESKLIRELAKAVLIYRGIKSK